LQSSDSKQFRPKKIIEHPSYEIIQESMAEQLPSGRKQMHAGIK
jgi:hypothetical protein